MAVKVDVDGLTFEFPDSWKVGKYDDWKFYRNQIGKHLQGLKAVDLLAVNKSEESYLIEVKDYSLPGTIKPSELPEAMAWKVVHTLAALLPASLNANDDDEKSLAAAVLKCRRLHIVLHADNPANPPNVIDPADLQQKLKSLLKAVDVRVKVSSRDKPAGVPWTVKKP